MNRISELHYSNAYAGRSGVQEFLEVALAPDADPSEFTVGFYQSTGSQGLSVQLDHPDVMVSYDSDSNEMVYVISAENFSILLTDPDGNQANNYEAYALAKTGGSDQGVIDFYDIGGGTQNILANGGVADGHVSENIPVPTNPNSSTYSLQFNKPNPTELVYQETSLGDSGVVCFAKGTRIKTPNGQTSVEELAVGDLVDTLDDGPRKVRWIGCVTVPAHGKFAPIVLGAGALGNAGELRLSPEHRVLVQGAQCQLLFGAEQMLVAAKHLVNGDTIYRCPGGLVTYFHIMFDAHQIIWAEGQPAESLHLTEHSMQMLSPGARMEISHLFPDAFEVGPVLGQTARPPLRRYESQLLN